MFALLGMNYNSHGNGGSTQRTRNLQENFDPIHFRTRSQLKNAEQNAVGFFFRLRMVCLGCSEISGTTHVGLWLCKEAQKPIGLN